MTKEERELKIKAIYKKIADKTLSFGCIVKYYPCRGKQGEKISRVGELYELYNANKN